MTPLRAQVPFRKRLRIFTEDRRVEGTIMVVVLIYFLVIVLDFSVPEIVKAVENAFTEEYQSFSAPPASQPAASLTPVVHATSRVCLPT